MSPSGTDPGTATSTSSATSVSPTCSLSALPPTFYLKSSASGYIEVDLDANEAIGVSTLRKATLFHINSTNDGSITGIDQLSFNTTDSVEYGAWIQTNGIDGGSKIQFFNSTARPEFSGGFGIVYAVFSTYLCQMSLITWMEHDLSYPEDCEGALWLDGGSPNSGCQSVNVTVATASAV